MVDAVTNVLITKLVEIFLNEGFHLPKFHEQFKTVNEELQLMQSYIEHVEGVKRKDHNKHLKTVVGQLRERLYDAEDIILDCKLFLERRGKASKLKRYCSPLFWNFRYQVGKKLSEINQDIQNHLERMKPFIPAISSNHDQLGNNRPVSYPILTKDVEIVGMEDDVNKIKQWVLNPPQRPLNIIGIVGMGGIGKTTLAQKIQKDGDMKNAFEHILMVTVSQTFQFEESVKVMLKSISGPRDFANINFQNLLLELQDRLERKKCLVILDDVWSLDEGLWWESLKSVLVHSSTCVIVTTRDVDVALSMGAEETRTHRHQPFSNEDSWSLFTKIAFSKEGGQCPKRLEDISKKIVDRCGGLPLAIKVVGGMMMTKGSSTDEWEQISKNLIEELDEKGGPIFSILQLSYDELPSHLKPCLLCLAVFPEDSDISSKDIIAWWIGEGFVREGKQGRTLYDIGKEYLDELMSRCLLVIEHEEYFGAKDFWFRMHDMVREMIRRVATEEDFICINEGGKSSNIQSRRVGVVRNLHVSEQNNLKSLRTIRGFYLEESEFVKNLGSKLCQLKWLRVLNINFKHLSQPPAVDWLSGIGSLQHLVCLQIRNAGLVRLPDSIGNLQSLQILILRNCPNLKGVPENIASLAKLSILNLIGSRECLPIEIGDLQQLCGFSFTVNSKVKDGGFRISSLKKLTKIRQLDLDIDSKDGIEDEELMVLSELTQLESLSIRFPSNNNNDVQELLRPARKVVYELPPLYQLSELYLRGDLGEKTAWLNPTSLPKLRLLHIYGCKSLTCMSPEFFGEDSNNNDTTFWKLEVLFLARLYNLEEEWPRIQQAMPSLRFLKVLDCPKFKGLPFDHGEDGTGIWRRE